MEDQAGWITTAHSASRHPLTRHCGGIRFYPHFRHPPCMLSFGPGQGAMFCTLCRGVDHTRTQCALLSLHPPANCPPNTPPTTPKRKSDNICISWNRGLCIFPGICGYRHVCATCHLPHKARDCSKTPDGSIYKQQRGPPPQPSPHTPPTAPPHARL